MTSQSLPSQDAAFARLPVDDSLGACTVQTHHRASHTVLQVSGEIDLHSVDSLNRAFAEMNGASHGRVVVDIEHVAFIGAAGLNALVAAHSLCRRAGGHLEVRTTSPMTIRLLKVTGLTHLLAASN
jgi:anti-sigma B factor antagonist